MVGSDPGGWAYKVVTKWTAGQRGAVTGRAGWGRVEYIQPGRTRRGAGRWMGEVRTVPPTASLGSHGFPSHQSGLHPVEPSLPPISHELFLTGLSRPGHTPGSRGQACPPLPLTSCIPLGQPTWRSLRQPCRGKVHQKPCPLSPGVSLCLQAQALGAVLGPSDFQAPLPL